MQARCEATTDSGEEEMSMAAPKTGPSLATAMLRTSATTWVSLLQAVLGCYMLGIPSPARSAGMVERATRAKYTIQLIPDDPEGLNQAGTVVGSDSGAAFVFR